MEPLTKEEIDQMEHAVTLILSIGSNTPPLPYFDRLCYTARLGAEFVKQTEKGEN